MTLVLRASDIHGVGVFTTRSIRRGEPLSAHLFPRRDWIWQRLDRRGVLGRFSYRDPQHRRRWYCMPANPSSMCIGWYLNHSYRPSVACYPYRATRHIRAGEELTIDYDVLEGR